MRHKVLSWFLIMGLTVCSFGNDPVDLPEGISQNWWSQAQRHIAESEYNVSRAQRKGADVGEALQAPNRKQNFRTRFMDNGFTIQPRKTEEVEWRFGLQLIGYGPEGKIVPVHASEPEAKANRVHYPHDEIIQWCENREDGLEHGFTVNYPADGDILEVRMAITGNLVPSLANETTMDLVNQHGVRVLTYEKLIVKDAEGRTLSASFQLKENILSIMTDAQDAVYPIKIDPLASTPSWTAESDQADAQFGYSISSAGDVNGDGYSDVIVGAHNYENGEADEGRAFVYLGYATGLRDSPVWTAESDQIAAVFGTSVASAGDVNGDGFSDVIVGAEGYSNGQVYEGRAFLYHGSASGLSVSPAWTAESNKDNALFGCSVASAGDVNGDGYSDVIVGAKDYNNVQIDEGGAFLYLGSSTGLSDSPAWTTVSNQVGARFGTSVASAGDVNGDGYSDVIVGAEGYSNGQTNEGGAFLYHGSATGLNASPTWAIESDKAGAYFGNSVASAGDVNGDGYSDVIVGAEGYSNGQNFEGGAFLYLGSATGLSASPSWSAESDQANAQFGFSVSSAGDVNGDGYADVIVGAPHYDNGETNQGCAYVYFGSNSGLTTVAKWSAESDQASAQFGFSVSSAGDVNGDGYADVIVGGPYYDNGETNEGRAYVYLGSNSGLTTVATWSAESDQADAEFGYSVASAGDVNGDGYSEVIVGAPYYDNGQTDEGCVFVYYGSSSGLSSNISWMAESDQQTARFGYSVSTAGDVNGDGYSDILVGSHYFENGEGNEGRVFLYYGSSSGLGDNAVWTAESDQVAAWFGYSVSTAGDVNGDGYSDVIIGARQFSNGESREGRAYVYHGSSSGLSSNAVWTAESDQVDAYFSNSVSTAGDVNGDGYSDVIVGAAYFDNGDTDTGQAYVFLGSPSGLFSEPSWIQHSNQGYAYFGFSVSLAGDVNGDGYSDVIVSAPYYDNGQYEEGQVSVFYGSSSGLKILPDWTVESNIGSSYFGMSVSSAGDVNGDGYSDVIIGAPYYGNGESREGRAYVYHGSSSGLSNNEVWTAESDQVEAYFGKSVSTAGDVNGDGYSDVIVGAELFDGGQTDEGRAFVYYGNGGPGLSMTPGQSQTSDNSPISLNGNSNMPNAVTLKLRAHTPMGRTRVKLQWEVALLNIPFSFANILAPPMVVIDESADWIDTVDGTAMISEAISGLSVNSPCHWRVRLLYHPADALFGQTSSRWYSIQDRGWNDVDFRTANPSYTISGTVTDGTNPIPDVTITFSYDDGTVVTDATGSYSYTVPYGTTTTISASHIGYSNWSPPFIVVNNITADQPNQDFMASANGYIVSGTVNDGTNPINGAALTFSHDGSVVYSDVSGAYSTTVPYGTTTTITPSAAGYSSWSPGSRTLTDITGNQTGQDFTAILNGVTVSGYVTDGTANPLQGVTIAFSHDGGTVSTDASGNYVYTVAYGTSTTIIPSLPNHTFSPVQISLINILNDTPGQNFSATTESYTITATSGPGGTVTPSGSIPVVHGNDQRFECVPDAGYHVSYVLVDGDSVSNKTSYTFRSVTDNHTIHVDFDINQPPVIDRFESDKKAGNLPLNVTFTCEAHDPDGGGIVQYQWDADGDGLADLTTSVPEVTRTFKRTGEYPVTVTVRDDDGETAISDAITITVTDASPIILPVAFGDFLNEALSTEDSGILFRVINPFLEEMTLTVECIDEEGIVYSPRVIHVPAHGKVTLNPIDYVQEGIVSLRLSGDHYYLITSEVEGASFRSSSYLPLTVTYSIVIPHVAEEVSHWQSLGYASNEQNMLSEVNIHSQTYDIDQARALQLNLTEFLPETPQVSESWGTLSISTVGPFGNNGKLTGFELFVRDQSDGGMVELQSTRSNTLYIPHIPTETDMFWTGFAFVNPSDVPVSAHATLYSETGEITGTYSFEVPAYSKIKGVLEDIFSGSEGSASWGVVECDGPGLIGMELYGTDSGGICGFSLNGETFEEGFLPLIEYSDITWTGLAFTNPGEEDAEITLTLLSETGEVIASNTGTLSPGKRLSGTVNAMFFNSEEIHSGQTVRFTSTRPILAVEAMGDNDWTWMKAIGAGK